MIIYISDDETPKDRRKKLELLPVIYALHMFDGCTAQASSFLGVTAKCLRNKFHKYPELKMFLNQEYIADRKELSDNPVDHKNLFAKKKRWHLQTTREKFWFQSLPENEQKKILKKIEALY